MNYKKPKHGKVYTLVFGLLLLSVFGSVVVGILLYSNNVKLAKDVSELELSIDELEDEIVGNKNDLYATTDFQDLESTVEGLGLIREPSPSYLDLKEVSQLSYR